MNGKVRTTTLLQVAPAVITFTRSEGLDVLSALDVAALFLVGTRHLTVLLEIDDAKAILVDRLFGGFA